jgi:hypothetical protein
MRQPGLIVRRTKRPHWRCASVSPTGREVAAVFAGHLRAGGNGSLDGGPHLATASQVTIGAATPRRPDARAKPPTATRNGRARLLSPSGRDGRAAPVRALPTVFSSRIADCIRRPRETTE